MSTTSVASSIQVEPTLAGQTVVRVVCVFIVCRSPRGRPEQILNLSVEISGDQES